MNQKEINLNEKIDRIVKLLNICPVCLSGYMRHKRYGNTHMAIAPAKDTWNEEREIMCASCFHSIKVPNPDYVPPGEPAKIDSENEDIESFMEWY